MLARFGKPFSSLGARRGLVYSLALVLALAARAATLSAAEPTSPQLFREQLDSGEFAPALQLAQQIDHTPERDAWLVQLAQAQAQAGARDAAFSSLSSVADDRIRGEAAQSTSKIASPPGAFGGTQADFRSLIDLITSTVKPSTWDEVGGPGSVSEFRNGVYVDADGMLKRALRPRKAHGLAVARLDALKVGENTDTRRAAPLRKVSLTRLEKHVQLSLAAGRPLTDEMLAMAGLEKIKYVMVYPDLGDLVIAGPASDWRRDDEDRLVSRKSGRPVLQLDDLVVVLRYLTANPHATFGCSINPTEEGLARTKAFADRSSATPLKPGQRPEWLKTLRAQMGPQTIAIDGIDPHTRAARVLVEADYRMKLVGMGLEDGTIDVPSYLSLIQVAHGEAPPALDVLRWWFTLKYDAVHATDQRDAFELRGTGVQVMSENELLTSLGQQVHTGKSEPLNQEFAQRFTQHFAALAQKYPVYADLQNIFDLALMTALINSEHLADRVGWHMTCFGDPVQYHVAVGPAPQMVDTIINHRVVNQKHIIVGVSGGVRVEPWTFASGDAIETDNYGKLDAERTTAAAKNLPLEAWWWD